ncbi:hypothetical protein MAN_05243, partial [Metarhizium hybridum]
MPRRNRQKTRQGPHRGNAEAAAAPSSAEPSRKRSWADSQHDSATAQAASSSVERPPKRSRAELDSQHDSAIAKAAPSSSNRPRRKRRRHRRKSKPTQKDAATTSCSAAVEACSPQGDSAAAPRDAAPGGALGAKTTSSQVQPVHGPSANQKLRDRIRQREGLKRLYTLHCRILDPYDPTTIGSSEDILAKLNSITFGTRPRKGALGTFDAAVIDGSLLFLNLRRTLRPHFKRSLVAAVSAALGLRLRLCEEKYMLRLKWLLPCRALCYGSLEALDKIRKDNGVLVSQVAQRFSTWYATFTDLDQALEALAKNKFWIGGQLSTVCPILEDSVPIFCYNCSAPAHMHAQCSSKLKRCGKCSAVGQHDTKHCHVTVRSEMRCPNCGLKGHAAFDTNCEYPASKAEWKRASIAKKTLPAWAAAFLSAQAVSTGVQHNPWEGMIYTQKPDEIARLPKRRRQAKAASEATEASGEEAEDGDCESMDDDELESDESPKKRGPGRPKNPPKLDASQTSLDGFYKPSNSQA